MAAPQSKTELLKAQAMELVKSHTVYDGSNRPQFIYVAQSTALNNDPCIKTAYTYDSTSSRVVGRSETYDVWNSAWDI